MLDQPTARAKAASRSNRRESPQIATLTSSSEGASPSEAPSDDGDLVYAVGAGVVDTFVVVPVAGGGSVLPESSRNGG